jgi:hypothetical protein
MKTSRTHKTPKEQALLVSVAESIGSTLGTIAAKAGAAQRAISDTDVIGTVKSEAEKVLRKSKRAVGQAKRSVKRAKPARPAGRTVRRAKRATSKGARAKK